MIKFEGMKLWVILVSPSGFVKENLVANQVELSHVSGHVLYTYIATPNLV